MLDHVAANNATNSRKLFSQVKSSQRQKKTFFYKTALRYNKSAPEHASSGCTCNSAGGQCGHPQQMIKSKRSKSATRQLLGTAYLLLRFAVRNNNCPKEKHRVLLMPDVTHAALSLLSRIAEEHENMKGCNCAGEVEQRMQVQRLENRRVFQAKDVLWHPEKSPAAEVDECPILV